MYQIADFTSQVILNAAIHHAYPNKITELQAIATALGGDATTHDATIRTAPAGLRPAAAGNSRFANDVLLVVNAGKAGNLLPAAMAAAITNGLAQFIPPTNTAAPVASFVTGSGAVGSVLTSTLGTWTGAQTYSRQWLRGGVNIAGATGTTYTAVAADSGLNVSCMVTARNQIGETLQVSNGLAIT